MRTVCMYFQVHQPFRLKRYRFFDIGNEHYYYDDFRNEDIIRQMAERCYVPANRMLLDMISVSGGRFRVALSVSGTALEQLEVYTPEVIDGFRELAGTGCVEFLGETYAHSLSSLVDGEEFRYQATLHRERLRGLLGVEPQVFRNTELIYSDEIGEMVSGLGYEGMLAEGARHVLGWKSPNYVYSSVGGRSLKLLLKNDRFSEDISLRFNNYGWSEYPLTADKYMSWLAGVPSVEPVVNLFMNYDVLGSFHPASSGIFDFFKALPRYADEQGVVFALPREVLAGVAPVGTLSVAYPMSWVDEEKDCSSWTGNVLQQEALAQLKRIGQRVRLITDRRIRQDWIYLQSSDHFYYMNTKHPGERGFSPYENPYEAFNNYMNVLSDFIFRVEAQYPLSIENEELNALLTTIRNQGEEIERLQKENGRLKKRLGNN